ncbi:conserved hypothetical protein [Candidatus Sulfopaludibacter sp. SbA3]|nr:conserved hypothetical protein [Candidatus Sulfopaludibacter sp. SbA3]
MFAMSGASRNHNAIAWQLQLLVAQHILGRKCQGYTSDTRVLVTPGELYTYPDLSATCDEPRYADERVDTLLNPTLVVEITSPGTEDYDRGKKARLYRAMPSLKDLLLVAQDQYDVELYQRRDDGNWSLFHAVGLEASVHLASIDCTLRLAELYARVVLETKESA